MRAVLKLPPTIASDWGNGPQIGGKRSHPKQRDTRCPKCGHNCRGDKGLRDHRRAKHPESRHARS